MPLPNLCQYPYLKHLASYCVISREKKTGSSLSYSEMTNLINEVTSSLSNISTAGANPSMLIVPLM